MGRLVRTPGNDGILNEQIASESLFRSYGRHTVDALYICIMAERHDYVFPGVWLLAFKHGPMYTI